MLDQGADRVTFKSASREDGSMWAADSWDSISEEIVKNSWRKSHFTVSYFTEEVYYR